MDFQRTHTAQSSYNDLNRLNRLKVGEDRDSEANMREVAQEFESLFISEMMKAMRAANDVLADDLFNSNESKTYRDMYDQQMALTMAEGRGMGMADVLVRQMSQMQQPQARPNPFALADDNKNKVELPTAAVAEPVAAKVEPAAAEPQKYIHVADTTTVKFRRFTGVMPGAFAQAKAAVSVEAPSAVNAGEAASAPNAPTPAASNAQPNWVQLQQAAAARSYAEVKDVASREAAAPVAPVVSHKTEFNSPSEFVATMLPMAQDAAERLGVDPHYLVAQAALETGWGKRMVRDGAGENAYNLFGIKSHGWGGQSANAKTTEFINGAEVKLTDTFRKYDSFAHSFNDYVDFLQSNPRYKQALQSTGNAEQYVRELQRAGYATDPKYADKISRIARQIYNEQPSQIAQAPRVAVRT